MSAPRSSETSSLALEALGHIAARDALREALDDGGLADARGPDQHGVVLGAARKHLDRAPDLLVAADDGVELAGPGASSVRSRPYFCERLVLRLRVLVGDALVAAEADERLVDRSRASGRRTSGWRAVSPVGLLHAAEEQVLRRHVVVLQALGLLFRGGNRAVQRLPPGRPGCSRRPRPRGEPFPERTGERLQRSPAWRRSSRGTTPSCCSAQRDQQVLYRQLLVLELLGEVLRSQPPLPGPFR